MTILLKEHVKILEYYREDSSWRIKSDMVCQPSYTNKTKISVMIARNDEKITYKTCV